MLHFARVGSFVFLHHEADFSNHKCPEVSASLDKIYPTGHFMAESKQVAVKEKCMSL